MCLKNSPINNYIYIISFENTRLISNNHNYWLFVNKPLIIPFPVILMRSALFNCINARKQSIKSNLKASQFNGLKQQLSCKIQHIFIYQYSFMFHSYKNTSHTLYWKIYFVMSNTKNVEILYYKSRNSIFLLLSRVTF